MKVFRYNTISCIPKVMKVEEMELEEREDYGESLADMSAFVPTSDAVRSLPVGDIGKEFFDFPDGVDTGEPVPMSRKRGKDIAEISTEIKNIQDDVRYNIKEIKSEVNAMNELNALKQSVENGTSGTSNQPKE